MLEPITAAHRSQIAKDGVRSVKVLVSESFLNGDFYVNTPISFAIIAKTGFPSRRKILLHGLSSIFDPLVDLFEVAWKMANNLSLETGYQFDYLVPVLEQWLRRVRAGGVDKIGFESHEQYLHEPYFPPNLGVEATHIIPFDFA
jgi:hypothetical protein